MHHAGTPGGHVWASVGFKGYAYIYSRKPLKPCNMTTTTTTTTTSSLTAQRLTPYDPDNLDAYEDSSVTLWNPSHGPQPQTLYSLDVQRCKALRLP